MKFLRVLLWFHSWRLAVWAGRHNKAKTEAFELNASLTERHPVLIAKARGGAALSESLMRFHEGMAEASSAEIFAIQRKRHEERLRTIAREDLEHLKGGGR